MDIKHLDYYREIVDSKFNLSKAANKLHITQPSLSMLINSWEKQYGIKLFNKHKGRYIGLTKEGEYIYNHALQVITLHNEFLFSLEEIKKGFKGNVKVGIPPLIISLLFNKCIPDFINEFPNIQINIVEEGALQLQKKLANGDIDVAILIEPLLYEIFDTTTLYNDRLIAIVNNNLKASNKESVSLSELASDNLITFTEEFALFNTITQAFKKQLLHPKITFKTSQWDLIVDIVKNSNSFAIMPAPIASKVVGSSAVSVDLIQDIPWTVLMATNSSKIKTPSLKFFEDYLVNYFRKSNPNNYIKNTKPINIL